MTSDSGSEYADDSEYTPPSPKRWSRSRSPSRRIHSRNLDEHRRSKSKKPLTFVGRVADDCVKMPWDKVLAGLITALIIYVGAARIHFFGDSVSQMQVDVHKLRNELIEMQKTDAYRLELQMAATEMRINKLLKQEIKNVLARLDDARSDIHELDKRLVLTEVRSQLYSIPIPESQRKLPDGEDSQLQDDLKKMIRHVLEEALTQHDRIITVDHPVDQEVDQEVEQEVEQEVGNTGEQSVPSEQKTSDDISSSPDVEISTDHES